MLFGMEEAATSQQQDGADAPEHHAGFGTDLQENRMKSSGMNNKLSEKKLRKLQDVYNKRAIIYISRIPPHMVRMHAAEFGTSSFGPHHLYLQRRVCHLQKPQKLRHMLSQHGEIGRLYLAPEGEPRAAAPAAPACCEPLHPLGLHAVSQLRV
jgi:hypothetical protein